MLCHVCVGKAAHPPGGGTWGGGVASEHYAATILCGPRTVPPAPAGPGRITQAVLRHISLGTEALPAAAGEPLGARGDAARVARCPGQALCLPLLACPLSDRHIGAALGGQGSLGKGTQAGDAGRLQMTRQLVWICRRSVLGGFWFSISALFLGCQSLPGMTSGCQRLAQAAAPQGVGLGAVAAQGCWEQKQAAELCYQVSVSLVMMGPAGYRPPPWPGSPARVGNGGNRSGRRGAASRHWLCKAASRDDAVWDASLSRGCGGSCHADTFSHVSPQSPRP